VTGAAPLCRTLKDDDWSWRGWPEDKKEINSEWRMTWSETQQNSEISEERRWTQECNEIGEQNRRRLHGLQ